VRGTRADDRKQWTFPQLSNPANPPLGRRFPNIMNAAHSLPVVVAVCLCGCASSRSNVSTENEEPHVVVRKVDYSATPEMKELPSTPAVATKCIQKSWPVGDDTAKLPHQFDIVSGGA